MQNSRSTKYKISTKKKQKNKKKEKERKKKLKREKNIKVTIIFIILSDYHFYYKKLTC